MTQKYEETSHPLPMSKIILNNFIGGLFWALGATIGLSLIVALLTLIAHYVDIIPIFGTFISHIIDFVLKTNHSLQK